MFGNLLACTEFMLSFLAPVCSKLGNSCAWQRNSRKLILVHLYCILPWNRAANTAWFFREMYSQFLHPKLAVFKNFNWLGNNSAYCISQNLSRFFTQKLPVIACIQRWVQFLPMIFFSEINLCKFSYRILPVTYKDRGKLLPIISHIIV